MTITGKGLEKVLMKLFPMTDLESTDDGAIMYKGMPSHIGFLRVSTNCLYAYMADGGVEFGGGLIRISMEQAELLKFIFTCIFKRLR